MIRNLCLVILFFSPLLWADILHEGWYKVESTGVHVGYVVMRTEYLPNKKQFRLTQFLKTNEAGGNIVESLQAISNQNFKPISYQYRSVSAGKPKTIDAVVKNNVLQATINEEGQTKSANFSLTKGSFFSSFLTQMILKNGLSVGNVYDYTAIAEEEAVEAKGRAEVKELTKYQGNEAFRIINDFKQSRFNSFLSAKGMAFATHAPLHGLRTSLMPSRSAATANIPVNFDNIKALFGNVPGAEKITKKEMLQQPKATTLPPKMHGVPPGKGIHVKPGAKKGQ